MLSMDVSGCYSTYQGYPYNDSNGYLPIQDINPFLASQQYFSMEHNHQTSRQQYYTGNNFAEGYLDSGNQYNHQQVPLKQQTQVYHTEQKMAPFDYNNRWVAHGTVMLNAPQHDRQFYQEPPQGHLSVQDLSMEPRQRRTRSQNQQQRQSRSRKRHVQPQPDVQGYHYQSSGQLPSMEAAYGSYPIAHPQQHQRSHQQMYPQSHKSQHQMGHKMTCDAQLMSQMPHNIPSQISQFSPQPQFSPSTQNHQQTVPQMSLRMLQQKDRQAQWLALKQASLAEKLKTFHQSSATDKDVATSADSSSGTPTSAFQPLTEEEKRGSELWRILHEVDTVEELLITLNNNRPLIPIDAQDVIEFESSNVTNIPMPTDHLILKFKESPNVFACS